MHTDQSVAAGPAPVQDTLPVTVDGRTVYFEGPGTMPAVPAAEMLAADDGRASAAAGARLMLELEQGGGMYVAAFTRDGKLTHSRLCEGKFGRVDPRCPRCRQISNGKPTRGSSHAVYVARRTYGLMGNLFEAGNREQGIGNRAEAA